MTKDQVDSETVDGICRLINELNAAQVALVVDYAQNALARKQLIEALAESGIFDRNPLPMPLPSEMTSEDVEDRIMLNPEVRDAYLKLNTSDGAVPIDGSDAN
jgi:hypothetical protein